jgi:hypothetical protein
MDLLCLSVLIFCWYAKIDLIDLDSSRLYCILVFWEYGIFWVKLCAKSETCLHQRFVSVGCALWTFVNWLLFGVRDEHLILKFLYFCHLRDSSWNYEYLVLLEFLYTNFLLKITPLLFNHQKRHAHMENFFWFYSWAEFHEISMHKNTLWPVN